MKPHVLRSWESRHAAVTPERTKTNRRLYTVGDIKRLRLINEAVSMGNSISHVASLNDDELMRIIERGNKPIASSSMSNDNLSADDDLQGIISDAIERIRCLDQVGLERVLDNAAVILTRSRFMNHVIQPLFIKIGEMWAAGELKIINERLATLVVRSQLLEMMRSTVLSESAPRLVVAAPVGQWHETGCLVVALTAAEYGWRPMYFGPNLPAEEIAAASNVTNSKLIALSIGYRIDPSTVVRELRKLRNYCADKANIIAGGYGVVGLKSQLETIGVRCITDEKDFSKELETS